MLENNRWSYLVTVFLVSALLLPAFAATAQEDVKQAPAFAEDVESGNLPPLEERLPKNPKVVEPFHEIGQYGGTIRRAYTGVGDFWNLFKSATIREPMVHKTQGGTVEPNLVTDWEYLRDGKALKLHVREGVKWSDGHPFTVEDIIYNLKAQENDNIPRTSTTLSSAVKLDQIEKVDKYTVILPLERKVIFEYAYTSYNAPSPKHYLKQFDPRYNDDMTWQDLREHWPTPQITEGWVDYPQLSAWEIVEYEPQERVVARRNPYFWKVDSEGKQLPYVNEMVYEFTSSADNIPLLVKAGDVDFQARHIFFDDYSFYKQNEEAGNYRTQILERSPLGPTIRLNYGVNDEKKRELFRTKEFRVALSLGIDRSALNETFYHGQAKPWGFSPIEKSSLYPGDEYAQMHTEYNPERANELLDELGLEDEDGDGIREVDGRQVNIIVDMDKSGAGGPVHMMEVIAEQWREIGVKATVNPIERSTILAHWDNNDYDAYAWKGDGGVNPYLVAGYWSSLGSGDYGNVGTELKKWVQTDGEEGVEPPAFIKEIDDLMAEGLSTLDSEERNEIGREMAEIHAENLYAIPTTTMVGVGVVDENLANVQESWMRGNATDGARAAKPWQFYYTS